MPEEYEVPSPHEHHLEHAAESGADGLAQKIALMTAIIATIAALISAGGLGFFILRGVEGSVGDLILLGAVPVVVVALLLDLFLRAVSWFLIPRGLRV